MVYNVRIYKNFLNIFSNYYIYSGRKGSKLILPTPGEGAGHCGIPAGQISGSDDNIATLYESPWSVLLKYGNGEYYGGGSLIHPRYVITTAHSVFGRPVEELKNVYVSEIFSYNFIKLNQFQYGREIGRI